MVYLVELCPLSSEVLSLKTPAGWRGHTSPGLCQHCVHHPGFIAVDLCINIFERQLSFLFGKGTKLFPPPLLLKPQKANEGLIDGGIEVERREKHDRERGHFYQSGGGGWAGEMC